MTLSLNHFRICQLRLKLEGLGFRLSGLGIVRAYAVRFQV